VEQDRWNLSGKLAISNDEDGGSGKLQWRENPGYTRMDFHGTLGRGAWRLEADRSGARLELADGSAYQDQTVDQLVQKQVGWEIPVESLSWWVRGMAAPGGAEERWFDERGNLVRLNQDGWSIEFGKYRSFGEFEMPIRLTAMQADWKVKLVVRRWELAPEGAPDD
jgi:outer membrane lipoprotein LolB